MNGTRRFKQPYYVSPHAVQRFRERVADLPTRVIRSLIMAALQNTRQIVQTQTFNKQLCPVFRAKYRNVDYLIPVIQDNEKTDAWPTVPTILLPGMNINPGKGERSGWRWN